jgi:hypothetical protein
MVAMAIKAMPVIALHALGSVKAGIVKAGKRSQAASPMID